MTFSHRHHLQRLMAEQGISEIHGVELARLVKMIANGYETIMSTHMRTQSLSGSRWRLLLQLYMAEQYGQAVVSPTQISKFQKVSKNTISALLRSLEDQGLIERAIDANDRRQFRIRLSDSGRELVRTATPGYVSFLNDLSADLSPAEIEQLRTLLQKLHGSLVRHGNLPDVYCLEADERPAGP